jgi:hypothetical protein
MKQIDLYEIHRLSTEEYYKPAFPTTKPFWIRKKYGGTQKKNMNQYRVLNRRHNWQTALLNK